MLKQDAVKFKSIIKVLAVNAGITDVSEEILTFYMEALKSFSIEQIDAASKAILKTWKYPRIPPVAVFIETIEKTQGKISAENKAEIEAGKILDHLKFHGTTKWPDLSDPISKWLMTHRWNYSQWAAGVLESELKWWRKEFKEAYEAREAAVGCGYIEAPNEVKKLAAEIGGANDSTRPDPPKVPIAVILGEGLDVLKKYGERSFDYFCRTKNLSTEDINRIRGRNND